MVETCTDCGKAAQGNMQPRAVRVQWTVDTLLGMHPGGQFEPDVIRVNVNHTLYMAERRHEARMDQLPDHEKVTHWAELGTAQKIDVVKSLVDFWPKEGVPA